MVGVILTCVVPFLVAWYVADKIEAHRPHWYKDPGGVKIPKVEVATLAAVIATLGFLATVSLVVPL